MWSRGNARWNQADFVARTGSDIAAHPIAIAPRKARVEAGWECDHHSRAAGYASGVHVARPHHLSPRVGSERKQDAHLAQRQFPHEREQPGGVQPRGRGSGGAHSEGKVSKLKRLGNRCGQARGMRECGAPCSNSAGQRVCSRHQWTAVSTPCSGHACVQACEENAMGSCVRNGYSCWMRA